MANEIKILMVDDDKMLIDLYKERLELAGFKVEISRDGEEGLAKIHETKPDLVLLDIMMPKTNGYEALSSIKSDPATKDIPVIILSALMRDINKSKAIEAGADDYIIKSEAMPVDVINKIESVLQKYKKTIPTANETSEVEQPKEAEETPSIMIPHTPLPAEISPTEPSEQNINFEPAAGGQDIQSKETEESSQPSEGPIAPSQVPPTAGQETSVQTPNAVPETSPQSENPLVVRQPVPVNQVSQEQKPSSLVVFFLILIIIIIIASDLFFALSFTR